METILSVLFWLFGAGFFAVGFYMPDVNMAVYFALAGVFCAITSGLVLRKS